LAAAGSDTKAKATDKPIEEAVADSPFFLIISFFPLVGAGAGHLPATCMTLNMRDLLTMVVHQGKVGKSKGSALR
jgi:hypothetical protein